MDRKIVVATLVGGVVPGVLIGTVAAAGILFGGRNAAGFNLEGLPEATVQNYRFAESHYEVLSHIPCYCGCYGLGHQNLFDCFVRPEGGYDSHASGCGICGRELDDVELLLAQGERHGKVRAAIDAEYSPYGRPTNTP